MIIEVVVNDCLELRYESEHVPVIGDRIVSNYTGYKVTERTWQRDQGIVELWAEME